MHDESKLPQWVQNEIGRLHGKIKELERESDVLRQMHNVIGTKEWFAILGPDFASEEESRTLYVLQRNSAQAVCSLGHDDKLFVGRNRSWKK